jgi:hypothetical protein
MIFTVYAEIASPYGLATPPHFPAPNAGRCGGAMTSNSGYKLHLTPQYWQGQGDGASLETAERNA